MMFGWIKRVIFGRYSNVYLYRVAFIPLCILVIFFVFNKNTYAVFNTPTLSWSISSPKLSSEEPVLAAPSFLCNKLIEVKDIAEDNLLRKVCLYKGESVSFGTVISDYSYRPMVSFLNDTKMYRVYGLCGSYDSCLYLSGTDTLVTRQYVVNNLIRSLVIYKNFSKRLTKQVNPTSFVTEYIFDSSNPEYIFKSSDGYAWPIGGLGSSDNGKWLAVEFYGRGFGLLNINTLEMKRVSSKAFSTDYGASAWSQFAVTNNGKTIAVMGQNTAFAIYEVDSNCGDITTDENMWAVQSIAIPCKKSPIQYGGFLYATHPSFSNDGYELSFYTLPYIGGYNKVSFRIDDYKKATLDYLALGDSFSSGEGEFDDAYYLDGTNDEFEKCHVSSRSYPFLIAKNSNINPENMKSVACSGAMTTDVVGDDYKYLGQNNRLVDKGLKMNIGEIDAYQTKSKISFHQGVIHQLSFVKIYQPKTITIGIGGNDIGMIDKLKSCISPGTCNWVADSKKREQVAIEIKNFFDEYVNTFQAIHDASPNSKIFAVGYPKPVDKDGSCGLLTEILLDSDEREFLNEAISYLNQVIKTATQKVGIGYLDIEESYNKNALCGDQKPSAFNSIMIGDDFSLSGSDSWIKYFGNESFHPNPYGHQLSADLINSFIKNISTYNYCSDGSVKCPQNYLSAPEPSHYWIPNGYNDYSLIKKIDFASKKDNQDYSQVRLINISNYSFSPNTLVEIEINSTPVSFGLFLTNSLGGLDTEVILPQNLEEGFHTMHVMGVSYSGESIDLYQVIEYQKIDNLTQEENDKNLPEKELIDISPSDQTIPNDIFEDDIIEKILLDNDDKDYYEQEIIEQNHIKIKSAQVNNDNRLYDNIQLVRISEKSIMQKPIINLINTVAIKQPSTNNPVVLGDAIISNDIKNHSDNLIVDDPHESYTFNYIVAVVITIILTLTLILIRRFIRKNRV